MAKLGSSRVSAGTSFGSSRSASSIAARDSGNPLPRNEKRIRSFVGFVTGRSKVGFSDHGRLRSLGIRRCLTAGTASQEACRSARTSWLCRSLNHFDHAVARNISEFLLPAAWPADFNLFRLTFGAQTKPHQRLARRCITNGCGGVIVENPAVRPDAPALFQRPDPCRLLRVPRSLIASQCESPVLMLWNSFAGPFITDTTASTRPSLSKSANATPRCIAAA